MTMAKSHLAATAALTWTILMLIMGSSDAIWLTLPSSGTTKCVSEDIQNNVVVLADYHVVVDDGNGNATAHTPTISARVTSPFGNNLHHHENVTNGLFAFTTKEAGVYLACFWVDVHHGGHEFDMTLSLDWKMGIAAKDWDTVAKKDKIEGVELELLKLEGIVQAIYENLNYLKDRYVLFPLKDKTEEQPSVKNLRYHSTKHWGFTLLHAIRLFVSYGKPYDMSKLLVAKNSKLIEKKKGPLGFFM